PSNKPFFLRNRWIAGSSPAMTPLWSPPAASPSLLLLVHGQHALRDQKAAEDVHRGECERDEAEPARPQRAVVTGHELDANGEQRADHDDRRDRVGHRHQRRVQRRRDRPHHVVTDEYGEHENREAEHERIDGLYPVFHAGSPQKIDQAALLGWKPGWTTAPSRVSTVALTISSFQSMASALVFLSTRIS